jgi:hypothetical protein
MRQAVFSDASTDARSLFFVRLARNSVRKIRREDQIPPQRLHRDRLETHQLNRSTVGRPIWENTYRNFRHGKRPIAEQIAPL